MALASLLLGSMAFCSAWRHVALHVTIVGTEISPDGRFVALTKHRAITMWDESAMAIATNDAAGRFGDAVPICEWVQGWRMGDATWIDDRTLRVKTSRIPESRRTSVRFDDHEVRIEWIEEPAAARSQK